MIIRDATKTESGPVAYDRVICIGDVHGALGALSSLWLFLNTKVISPAQLTATIFLGDFVDKGPHVRETLDFLLDIQNNHPSHIHPFFLCGNHEFAMAAFCGLLPTPDQAQTDCNRFPSHTHSRNLDVEVRRRLWTPLDVRDEGAESDMHLQGLRWAGYRSKPSSPDSIYGSLATFNSYKVPFRSRHTLLDALPAAHKDFLSGLPWIVELGLRAPPSSPRETESGEPAPPTRIIAIHAGFIKDKMSTEQMELLLRRDHSAARIPHLQNRVYSEEDPVGFVPPDLLGQNCVVVHGHHNCFRASDQIAFVDHPISALLLDGPKKSDWRKVNLKEGAVLQRIL